jgi:hypothetical protein
MYTFYWRSHNYQICDNYQDWDNNNNLGKIDFGKLDSAAHRVGFDPVCWY